MWISACKYVVLIFFLGPLSFLLFLLFNQQKTANIFLTKRAIWLKDLKGDIRGPSSQNGALVHLLFCVPFLSILFGAGESAKS